MYTRYTCIYTIRTPLNTSKHPIYTLFTPYIHHCRYDAPSITSIVGVDGSVNPLTLLGVGQQKVLLKGNNFGPVGTVVGATYVNINRLI